jgi:transcriptional regulator with XRE-family HTH domain
MFEKFKEKIKENAETRKKENEIREENKAHKEAERIRAEKESLYNEVINYVNFFYVEPEHEEEPEPAEETPAPAEKKHEEITYPDIFPLRDTTPSIHLPVDEKGKAGENDKGANKENEAKEAPEEEKHSAGAYASAANFAADTIEKIDREKAAAADADAESDVLDGQISVMDLDYDTAGHQFTFEDLLKDPQAPAAEKTDDTAAPAGDETAAVSEPADVPEAEGAEAKEAEAEAETAAEASGSEEPEAAEPEEAESAAAEEKPEAAEPEKEKQSRHKEPENLSAEEKELRDSHHIDLDKYSGEVPDDPVKAQRQDQMQTSILWAMVDKPQNTFGKVVKDTMKREDLTVSEICSRMRLSHDLINSVTEDASYHPTKEEVLAICFALRIKWEEAIKLMYKCGYIFSDEERYDLTNEYLMRKRIYDVNKINDVLSHFGFEPFGIN